MPLLNKGLTVGEKAPEWSLLAVDERRIGLEQFKGRPVLLSFYRGTWCPNCRKQMDDIRQAMDRLEPLAVVLGIVGQGRAEVSAFLARNPLPFPLLPDNERTVIKSYGDYQPFGLDGFRIAYPSTLVIDALGMVRYCYVGESQFDRPDLNQIILQLQSLNTTA